jgi:succinate dehydrogenase/fumarate reductase-like Fe-S protein
MGEEKLLVTVFRYDPSRDREPRYETYEVPAVPKLTVFDALTYIYENHTNLAFRGSCAGGWRGTAVCDQCGVKVNGRSCMACKTPATKQMTIEPLDKHRVIRDLVIEM